MLSSAADRVFVWGTHVYVWLWVFVCVYIWGCKQMHVHIFGSVSGGPEVSIRCVLLMIFIFWDRVSHWPCSSLIWLDQLTRATGICLSLIPQHWYHKQQLPYVALYVNSGYLNPSCHACTTQMESSPQLWHTSLKITNIIKYILKQYILPLSSGFHFINRNFRKPEKYLL